MFLRKQGASHRFTFDEIYSCLQKSLRRNDEKLAIEMGYEFAEYPNALKKRLIQNCAEDCPDLNLMLDIFNTPSELPKLMTFIPIICNHTKCRTGLYAMRIACEMDYVFDELDLENDDLIMLSRKLYTHICQKREEEFINTFQQKYKQFPLMKLYKFINKSITFFYCLNVWNSYQWMHEDYYPRPFKFDENKQFGPLLKLPNYIYDKHVHSSPANQRTYQFFIANCILKPIHDGIESEIDKEGKRIYLETNAGVTTTFREIVTDCEVLDSSKVQ